MSIIFGIGIGIAICIILNIIIDEFWNSRERMFNREMRMRILDATTDMYGIVESVISIYYPGLTLDVLKQDERDFVIQKSIEHIDRIKNCLTKNTGID